MGPPDFFNPNQELKLLFQSSVSGRAMMLCSCHSAVSKGVVFSIGAFEKVKPYKARHPVEMTDARHQDMLESCFVRTVSCRD
jgi:hypothetical protein